MTASECVIVFERPGQTNVYQSSLLDDQLVNKIQSLLVVSVLDYSTWATLKSEGAME